MSATTGGMFPLKFQSTPYTELGLLSAVVCAALCIYALRLYRARTDDRAVLFYFAVLMGTAGAWALLDAVQISLVGLEAKLDLVTVATVTTAIVPTAWLAMALAYTERESWLRPKTWTVLAVEPIVVVVAGFTTHAHDLFFYDATLVNDPGFLVLTRSFGPLFVGHALYSYALVVLGTIFIIRFVRFDQTEYRGQALLLAGGSLLPVATNAVYLSGVGGLQKNLTPIAMGVSGIAFAVAITRYRFLDLEPVARETVVESMRDGYVVCDDAGRIVDKNPAAQRLLGVEDELVGQEFANAVPQMADAFAAAAADEEVREEFVRAHGDRRFLDVSMTPMASVDGTLVLLRDVTEERETERRYQTLIEGSNDLITVLDEDGTIDYASPSHDRVLGLEPDAVIGECSFDLVHPEDREAMRDAFQRSVDDESRAYRVEYRVPDATGEWRVHESVGRNLLSDPDVEGVVVNSRDVTERKERQRELEAANERLERFASVVSHDLRNPLTVADGYAALLEERVDDPAIAEVRTSHDRMRRIVDDVLALSRTNEIDERCDVSLTALADEAWAHVETGEATLETTDATIHADRPRVIRLLENFFRNSVEHGGDDVVVTVGPSDSGFFIADDGSGVPEEVHDSLFEEGVSGGNGTGLGLAIVAEIVDAHGWSIRTADSDRGARFEITADDEPVRDRSPSTSTTEDATD